MGRTREGRGGDKFLKFHLFCCSLQPMAPPGAAHVEYNAGCRVLGQLHSVLVLVLSCNIHFLTISRIFTRVLYLPPSYSAYRMPSFVLRRKASALSLTGKAAPYLPAIMVRHHRAPCSFPPET